MLHHAVTHELKTPVASSACIWKPCKRGPSTSPSPEFYRTMLDDRIACFGTNRADPAHLRTGQTKRALNVSRIDFGDIVE